MKLMIEDGRQVQAAPALAAMFEARKRVFVDLLGWDVPVLAGRYELDQFDDPYARYLILCDADHRHLASARLLPTTRPHILDTLFPVLCEAVPPQGEDIWEITRFCLDRDLDASDRRVFRDALVVALVTFALETGIRSYVGVAETGWLRQILAFGWCCRPLGMPCSIDGMSLGALRIEITPDTPSLLAAAGVIGAGQARQAA